MSSRITPVTPEPDVPHRGLGVTDFTSPGLISAVRKAVSLLPGRKRRLLFFAASVQISLNLLDLLGIALIGLVAAVAVSGIDDTLTSNSDGQGIASRVQGAFEELGLGALTISQIAVILAVAAVFALVLKTLISAVMTRYILRFLAQQQAEVSADLTRRFLSRPLSEVQRWTTPEALYALGSGVGSATVALLGSAITIMSETFLFLIVGVTLLLVDPVITVAAIVLFSAIGYVLYRFLGTWSARNAQIMTDVSIGTMTAVSDALATYREATVLSRRDLYVDRYQNLVGRYATSSSTSAFILEIPKYVLEVALYLGIFLLGVVQFLTKDWTSAAATVALFLAAGSRIMPGLLRLQGASITIRNAAVQSQPTFFMYDYLERSQLRDDDLTFVRERPSVARIHSLVAKDFPGFVARVTLMDVSVTYPGAESPALRGLSLDVLEGQSVALVGPTGAGKSTLTDVLLGVIAPDAGSVSVSGQPPRVAIDKWPGAIAYVPQSVALVAGSVRQNVALGLPDELIDDDLVWDALRRAHLDAFLIEHREGLDTAVGERGFMFSGGQRQRLGIARALYTRPRLLVLDEATSALDAETEEAVIATMRELEGEVTTIVVAHRLATVRHVDEVLYLGSGSVIARGTFVEVRNRVPNFDKQASLLGL